CGLAIGFLLGFELLGLVGQNAQVARGGALSDALGQQEVAGVTRLDFEHVADFAEVHVALVEDDFHISRASLYFQGLLVRVACVGGRGGVGRRSCGCGSVAVAIVTAGATVAVVATGAAIATESTTTRTVFFPVTVAIALGEFFHDAFAKGLVVRAFFGGA